MTRRPEVAGLRLPLRYLRFAPDGAVRFTETVFRHVEKRETFAPTEVALVLLPDAEAQRALDQFGWIQYRECQEDVTATLRAMGRLVVQDRRDLWMALYLILRECDDTSEAIVDVVPTDGYQPNDELVFLFGERGGDFVGAAGEQ